MTVGFWTLSALVVGCVILKEKFDLELTMVIYAMCAGYLLLVL